MNRLQDPTHARFRLDMRSDLSAEPHLDARPELRPDPRTDLGSATPGSMFGPAPGTVPHRPDENRFDAARFRQAAGLARQPAEQRGSAVNRSSATASRASRSSGIAGRFSTYVAVWATLGVVSAAYLGTLTWHRVGLLDLEVAPVSESIERMATDIAELKQTTAAIDARQRATADRVTVTESRLQAFAQSAANLPQAEPHEQRATNRAALETAAPAQATQPAVPAATVANAGGQMPGVAVVAPVQPTHKFATVTTRQVPTLPAATATSRKTVRDAHQPSVAPPVAATSPVQTGSVVPEQPSGLLVASGPSLESVRMSWNILHQNHSAVLGQLEPRIVPSSDGSAFQLIAGPFASNAEAQKACTTLKSRGVGCHPAEFGGAPL